MKNIYLLLSVMLVAVLSSSPTQGADLSSVALNTWTCTNTAVGKAPVGVLFDGTNIWVSDETGTEIYKIQASTGTVLHVYAGGNGAQYIAYDNVNNNIWVTNPGSDNVTVINATSGNSVNYSTGVSGNFPDGIGFDGANMWVTNYLTATVTKMRAFDGAILQTIPVGTQGVSHPRFVVYDNVAKRIWVTIASDNKVLKINPDTGVIEDTYSVPGFPYAAVFDGTNIWVTQGLLNTVVKLRPSDGSVLGTYDAGVIPNGMTFDGTYIWITDQVSSTYPFPMDTVSTVTQLRASDGAHIGTYRVGERPQWVTTGAGYIWVTNGSDNTVSRCSDGTAKPAQLTITSVNGGVSPTAHAPFNVVVQAQDSIGMSQNVIASTSVTLSRNTGTGVLGGTLTCTIPAASNSCTVVGATYSQREAGVVITATRTSGDTPAAGNSTTFTVRPAPLVAIIDMLLL
jgi:glutamine cyclotransferase